MSILTFKLYFIKKRPLKGIIIREDLSIKIKELTEDS